MQGADPRCRASTDRRRRHQRHRGSHRRRTRLGRRPGGRRRVPGETPARLARFREGVTMDSLAHFDTWQLAALAATLGIASGLRLYAVLFIVGAAGYLGWVNLPSGLATLAHPLVLT